MVVSFCVGLVLLVMSPGSQKITTENQFSALFGIFRPFYKLPIGLKWQEINIVHKREFQNVCSLFLS